MVVNGVMIHRHKRKSIGWSVTLLLYYKCIKLNFFFKFHLCAPHVWCTIHRIHCSTAYILSIAIRRHTMKEGYLYKETLLKIQNYARLIFDKRIKLVFNIDQYMVYDIRSLRPLIGFKNNV